MARPVATPTALVVTDGKIGDLVQCRGVAEAMGLEAREFVIAPRWPWSRLAPGLVPAAPHLTVDPADQARLAEGPPPDIAIASGHRAAAATYALKRANSGRTFTVVLKDARAGTGIADFLWVPAHDRLRGPNVMTTPTSPHRLTAARIAAERAALPAQVAQLPEPRITVLVGGPSGRTRFSHGNIEALKAGLHALGAQLKRGSFLVTPSRRTPRALLDAVVRGVTGSGLPFRAWSGEDPNPYLAWMAAADALVVTGDSVNMVGEALAMGRPVLVHRPNELAPKIARFLDHLEGMGAVAPLGTDIIWGERAPIDATPAIAAEALRRYHAHRIGLEGRT